MRIVRTIDHRLYPREALIGATQVYSGFCSVMVQAVSEDLSQITVNTDASVPDKEEREVLLGFLNFVLDGAARLQLEEL